MGTVYLAEDPLLKRRVAIKVVRVTGNARHQAMLRFRREAEISAQLNHPNLVTIFDVGVEEDLGPFLAMEYVEGKSLGRHIKDRSLDQEASVRVLIQAMRALRAAHRRAIVHRDVKPDNILLSEEGRAKLMDFGIARSMGHMSLNPNHPLETLTTEEGSETGYAQTLALRLTSTGDFLGSPAYAPPEVLKGGEGTPASDRYSFAATAFELLTNQLPHPGSGLTEIIIHILQEPIALPVDLPSSSGPCPLIQRIATPPSRSSWKSWSMPCQGRPACVPGSSPFLDTRRMAAVSPRRGSGFPRESSVMVRRTAHQARRIPPLARANR
jgi:serine/threonine protein kinase